MPLDRKQIAKVILGTGGDYSRALGFNPGSMDIDLEEKNPSYPTILGSRMVSLPITSMKRYETAPGRAIGRKDLPEFPQIVKPTYEEKPITEMVTKPYVQWEAESKAQKGVFEAEKEGLNVIKQQYDNQKLAMETDIKNKVSNQLETDAIRRGINTPYGMIVNMASKITKYPGANPLDVMKFIEGIQRGERDKIEKIAKFRNVLLNEDNIDLGNPDTINRLNDYTDPLSQKVIERMFILDKDTKSYEDKSTGMTTFYKEVGNELIPIKKVKTDLSATEKGKQEKEKIRYAAQVGKEFREPRETTAEKVVTAEAIERMKIRVNQDKPLTPAENNARIAESQRIMKDLIDTGVDNARTHPLLKSYYEINPKETSVPYINNDKNVKMVILPTRKGKRITAKDVLNAANTAGLTISQTLRKAGYISD